MLDVATDIKATCKGKLDVLVVTHRHRDHISGFSIESDETGKVIAALQPNYVIQPWTEDPRAKPTALTATSVSYTKGSPGPKQLTSHFLGALEDMHAIAAAAAESAQNGVFGVKTVASRQIAFLGEDNLKNASAVKNLMAMGRKGKAYYVNAGMKLNSLLPGVKITVLGPPTLEQTESIRKERSKDPIEFWQFRSFWAVQSCPWRIDISPIFPQDPKLNVTLLH
jgi:hypothetical protein